MWTVVILTFCLPLLNCKLVTIPSRSQTVFNVTIGPKPGPDAALRVITTPRHNVSRVYDSVMDTGHVFFTVFYSNNINTWTLNVTGHENDRAEKTLCFTPSNYEVDWQEHLTIAAFSSLDHEEEFNVSANWMRNFHIGVDQTVTVEISPSSPHLLQFDIEDDNHEDEDEDNYLLHIESVANDQKCLYVGINEVGCPWEDTIATVTNSRLWARMLWKSYFPIRSRDFDHSFLVSLIPLVDSSGCFSNGKVFGGERDSKTVNVTLIKIQRDYSSPISWSTVTIVLCCAFFFVVWGVCWFWQQQNNENILERRRENNSNEDLDMNGGIELLNFSNTDPGKGDSHLILRRDFCKQIESDCDKSKHVINRLLRDKLTLHDTCQMIKDDSYYRRQRSKIYLYLIPLLSLFYLVPSVQMVFAEQKRSKLSGNMEMCYLNYGCSRPYGMFDDFNHIISNVGYVIYGVVFVMLVRLKAKFLPEENQTNYDHLGTRGLLQQFSLFYCMGICLILQGIFSAIFHTCPSNISLQFDTTMMYIMLILVFIKIYQFRHPDMSFDAFTVMYTFVIILFLEAISLYIYTINGKIIFYTLFSLAYIATIIHVAVDCYYYGAIFTRFPHNVPAIFSYSFKTKHLLYRKRFLLAFSYVFLNIGLLIFTFIRSLEDGPKGLSTPILVILSANVGMFLSYYMLRKFIEICDSHEGEGMGCRKLMRFLSFIFFSLAVSLGVCAMYFYYHRHQSRNRTPPESR